MKKVFTVIAVLGAFLSFLGCGGGSSAPAVPEIQSVESGSTENTITWDEVSGATAYDLYFLANATDASLTKATPEPEVIEDVTSPYLHEGLVNHTTYTYTLVAKNDSGSSDPSDAVTGTPEFVGAIDTSFGDSEGYTKGAQIPLPRYIVIKEDSEKNIVVLVAQGISEGRPTPSSVLYKFDSTGKLISTFGTSGKISSVTAIFSSFDFDSENNIYLVGEFGEYEDDPLMYFWKYDSNGKLVTGFGTNGIVKQTVFSKSGDIKCVEGDGCIIGASSKLCGAGVSITVWKYDFDGGKISSFGGENKGYFCVGDASPDIGYFTNSIDIDVDGRIVGAGVVDENEGVYKALAYRLTSSGLLDTTFTPVLLNYEAYLDNVKTDLEGNVYMSGRKDTEVFATKYSILGALDDGFGKDGIFETGMIGNAQAGTRALIFENSGTLIMGGYRVNVSGTPPDLVYTISGKVFAINPTDGSLAENLFTDGVFTIDSEIPADNSFQALSMDSLGRILGAGGGNFNFPENSAYLYIGRMK